MDFSQRIFDLMIELQHNHCQQPQCFLHCRDYLCGFESTGVSAARGGSAPNQGAATAAGPSRAGPAATLATSLPLGRCNGAVKAGCEGVT